jgi:membrane-bound ClpP family serine protease
MVLKSGPAFRLFLPDWKRQTADVEGAVMTALGVVLILAGLALFVAEAHAPTGGLIAALGVLGVAAGVWALVRAGGVGEIVAVPIAAGTGVLVGGVALLGTRTVLSARHSPPRQQLIGASATVRTWDGSQGQVLADGALWSACLELGDDAALAVGDSVVVERMRGLTLTVRRREPWEALS